MTEETAETVAAPVAVAGRTTLNAAVSRSYG